MQDLYWRSNISITGLEELNEVLEGTCNEVQASLKLAGFLVQAQIDAFPPEEMLPETVDEALSPRNELVGVVDGDEVCDEGVLVIEWELEVMIPLEVSEAEDGDVELSVLENPETTVVSLANVVAAVA
ncbi:hypothetical protein N0V90_009019 [Kalmusia sp. IMI 367209]|nr:hypothetical protein N0V90_009019 [Kalmusia sp. IMI 367209]